MSKILTTCSLIFIIGIVTTESCLAFSLLTPPSSPSSTTRTRTVTRTRTISTTSTTTTLHAREKSKWDLIVDEDDDNNDGMLVDKGEMGDDNIPIPPDMLYIERNVKRAHETFHNLRNIGGKEVCNDVYARSPRHSTNEEMFYIGKVSKISDVTIEDCIARQWNMIEHHASNLRPIELKPNQGKLELWIAPGDSELDVAYNRPTLQMIKMMKYPITSKELKNNVIGFQGEVYQDGEEGFRSWRTDDGYPARAEINEGGETRAPTNDELEQLQKELKDQNIDVDNVDDLLQEMEKQNAMTRQSELEQEFQKAKEDKQKKTETE